MFVRLQQDSFIKLIVFLVKIITKIENNMEANMNVCKLSIIKKKSSIKSNTFDSFRCDVGQKSGQ